MQAHESAHSGAVMKKLDDILERQRQTTTRDIVFGLLAAVIVVFQVVAFSSSETVAGAAPAIEETSEVKLVDEVKRHTSIKCGELHRAIDDLTC